MRHGSCQVVLIDANDDRRARLCKLAASVGLSGAASAIANPGEDGTTADLVILANDGDGIEAAIRAVRHAHPAARVIVLGVASPAAVIAALRAGADDFTPDDDVAIADRILHHLARAPRPDDDHGGLIGASPAMRRVRDFIRRIAPSDVTVLITGETGTGKELVARMLHRCGRNPAGPLIAVNCAAIPETLIEAELFGHARGAFTGADRAYPGKLGLADGGTLMLDEVGELSAAGQAKVLRALESREVWPVGGRAPVPFEARVVAATNRDLEREAAAGAYRRDLFYRLAVARIALPPLRERREDIAPIASALLADADPARRVRLDAAALDRLSDHDWPGNVRELKNVIEVALIGARRDVIGADDLPDWVAPARAHVAAVADPGVQHERLALLAALARAGGNKSRAAAALACSRMTLYRRMERHGLAIA